MNGLGYGIVGPVCFLYKLEHALGVRGPSTVQRWQYKDCIGLKGRDQTSNNEGENKKKQKKHQRYAKIGHEKKKCQHGFRD